MHQPQRNNPNSEPHSPYGNKANNQASNKARNKANSKTKNTSTPLSATNLPWQLAWRFYQAKSNIRVLSFINRLTKLGILLGISILLLTMSVINGFDRQLHDKFLNMIPQSVVFENQYRRFADPEKLEQELKRFNNVAVVEPIISRNVMLENGALKKVVNLYGVNPESFYRVSDLLKQFDSQQLASEPQLAPVLDSLEQSSSATPTTATLTSRPTPSQLLLASIHDLNSAPLVHAKAKYLEQDLKLSDQHVIPSTEELENTPSIILGAQLAAGLKLKIGDYVRLFVLNNNCLQENQYYLVSGIFDSGGIFDKELAIINIFDGAQIVGATPEELGNNPLNYANGFQLKLTDVDLDSISSYHDWNSDEALNYISWGHLYPNIKNDLPMIKSLLNLGLIFVVLLASFNVVCAILIQIKDKKKSLTSLQAIGFSTKKIHLVFFYYSLILSGVAAVLGSVIGVGASFALEGLSQYLLSSGLEVLDASNYFIDYLPVDVRIGDILLIISSIIAVSIITAFITSYRVNRVKLDLSQLT